MSRTSRSWLPRGPEKTQRQVEELLAHLAPKLFERDGEQCAYVDEASERCPSRGHLKLDHVEARALGGTNAASNQRVRCRAHNRLAAEEVFGKTHIAERIDFRQRRWSRGGRGNRARTVSTRALIHFGSSATVTTPRPISARRVHGPLERKADASASATRGSSGAFIESEQCAGAASTSLVSRVETSVSLDHDPPARSRR